MPWRSAASTSTTDLGGIVVHIALGLAHQFADLDVARHVNDRARLVAGKDLVEARGIADVAALERAPAHRPLVSLLQRVVADRRQARIGQRLADVTADIAGAAGDQDGVAHFVFPAHPVEDE